MLLSNPCQGKGSMLDSTYLHRWLSCTIWAVTELLSVVFFQHSRTLSGLWNLYVWSLRVPPSCLWVAAEEGMGVLMGQAWAFHTPHLLLLSARTALSFVFYIWRMSSTSKTEKFEDHWTKWSLGLLLAHWEIRLFPLHIGVCSLTVYASTMQGGLFSSLYRHPSWGP